MAEFQKVMADAKRMYTQIGDGNYPLYIGEINFEIFEKEVEQWAAEHPVKTNRDALKEVFTNLPHIQNETIILTEEFLNGEYKGGGNNGNS